MHLLSENGLWETVSEFVTPDGKVSQASGESEIIIEDTTIENRSRVILNGSQIENIYSIKKISENKYRFVAENPALGTQKGSISVDRNILYSRFAIENSRMYGFEVTVRNHTVCEAYGSLYNGEELVNTWKAVMRRKEK